MCPTQSKAYSLPCCCYSIALCTLKKQKCIYSADKKRVNLGWWLESFRWQPIQYFSRYLTNRYLKYFGIWHFRLKLGSSCSSVLRSKWVKEALKHWLYGSHIKCYQDANISSFVHLLSEDSAPASQPATWLSKESNKNTTQAEVKSIKMSATDHS